MRPAAAAGAGRTPVEPAATTGACHPDRVPEVDIVDSTWVGAPAAVVGAEVGRTANWAAWWPELALRVEQARGEEGMRWNVVSGRSGRVTGSLEVWLQPQDDGTVAHFFARLDGVGHPLDTRERTALVTEYRVRAKQVFWAVAARVDPGRMARVAAAPNRIP